MRQAKSHKPRSNFPTRTVLTDAPSTQRLRASTYFRWCGGRKVKRFVAATVRECSPRPRGTYPLALVASTHLLERCRQQCSKLVDTAARKVSTAVLERCRHACSRDTDILARMGHTHRPEFAYLIPAEGLIPRYSMSGVLIICRSHCCTLLQTSIKYSHIQTKLGT